MISPAIRQFIVGPTNGKRLDQYLVACSDDLSRSYISRLVKDGMVTVNGQNAKTALLVHAGDQITLTIPSPTLLQLRPEEIPLSVVYEDADIMVVDKPPGLPVHPSPGHPTHTLVNALLACCSDLSGIGGVMRPGIVHRLDKDTSGLILVAKNDVAHRSLSQAMKERRVLKVYWALVWGRPKPSSGIMRGPIGRDPGNRKRMAIVSNGREARTAYRNIQLLSETTLMELRPETGRTHQLRVHLASIGHPILGDTLYSRKRSPHCSRQFLHATTIGIHLPSTGQYVEFHAPLPQDLRVAFAAAEGLPKG